MCLQCALASNSHCIGQFSWWCPEVPHMPTLEIHCSWLVDDFLDCTPQMPPRLPLCITYAWSSAAFIVTALTQNVEVASRKILTVLHPGASSGSQCCTSSTWNVTGTHAWQPNGWDSFLMWERVVYRFPQISQQHHQHTKCGYKTSDSTHWWG